MTTSTLIVLDSLETDLGFVVHALDDRDGFELFRTDPLPSLGEALADARGQLRDGERVVEVRVPDNATEGEVARAIGMLDKRVKSS
jgi:hypothetical protein